MAEPEIGRSVARGASAIVGVAVLAKVMATLGQFVIAAYLSDTEYGLWGKALAIAELVGFVQFLGMREILVNRQKQADEWINAVFWVTVFAGIATLLAGGGLAYALPNVFGTDPKLSPLVFAAAVAVVVVAFSEIFQGKLALDFRFGTVAKITAIEGFVRVLGQITVAVLGFGALGLILVRATTWTCQTIAFAINARPRLSLRPDFARLREVRRDMSNIFLTRLAELALRRGDVLLLGVFAPDAITGVYFFAYGLSLQFAILICQSLSGVLSAGLSKLQDDLPRLRKAFFSAMRVLSFMGVPLLVIQAATCGPLLRLLYMEKWEAAIVPLQILSISACFSLAGWNTTAVFTARGLFRRQMYFRIGSGVVYLVAMTIAASQRSAVAVAIAQLAFTTVYIPFQITIATGGGWMAVRESVLSVFRPFSVAAAGAAVAIWTASMLDSKISLVTLIAGVYAGRVGEFIRLVMIASITGALYAAGARLILRGTYGEFAQRMRQIMPVRLASRIPAWML